MFVPPRSLAPANSGRAAAAAIGGRALEHDCVCRTAGARWQRRGAAPCPPLTPRRASRASAHRARSTKRPRATACEERDASSGRDAKEPHSARADVRCSSSPPDEDTPKRPAAETGAAPAASNEEAGERGGSAPLARAAKLLQRLARHAHFAWFSSTSVARENLPPYRVSRAKVKAALESAEGELLVSATTLVLCAVYAVNTFGIPHALRVRLQLVELALTALFVLEFFVRWWVRSFSWRHLTRPLTLVDLVAIMPIVPLCASMLPPALGSGGAAAARGAAFGARKSQISTQFLRIVRLFRVLRISRVVSAPESAPPASSSHAAAAAADDGDDEHHRHYRRDPAAAAAAAVHKPSGTLRVSARSGLLRHLKDYQLTMLRILLTLFSIIFVWSGLIFNVEHRHQPQVFSNFLDAFEYCVGVMAVGFSPSYPISHAGRLLTTLMILSGSVLIPWQATTLVRNIVFATTKREALCTQCGCRYHDEDAVHCKMCGRAVFQDQFPDR